MCVCLCMCVCVGGGGECMTNVPSVLWQYVDFTGPRRNAFLEESYTVPSTGETGSLAMW